MSWAKRLKDAILHHAPRSDSDPPAGAPVENVPALARYVAESLGWDWQPVGTWTDDQGLIVVFRDFTTGRTQPICLTQQPDSWSVRAEIEREIRKAMAARGVSITGNQ